MSNRNYFLVGTKYDGKDEKLGGWVEKGIWKLGWEGQEEEQAYLNMKKIWDDIESGDILIAKNKIIRSGYSGIKVKGIAKVISKRNDDHTVNVEWLTVLDESDYLEFKIPSPATISRLEEELGLKIVGGVMITNYLNDGAI